MAYKIKQKILYIHHTPFFRGAATSLSYLLKELDRTRFTPIILLTYEGEARQAYEALGIDVYYLPLRQVWEAPSPYWYNYKNKFLNWLAFLPNRKFADFLKTIKPDLIHINDTCSLSAAITAKQLGIPVVCHVRSVHRTISLCSRKLIKSIYNNSDYLITISEEYSEQFQEQDKITVVYNSLDFDKLDSALKEKKNYRDEIGISKETILVGMVGTLTQHKGAWDFIKAIGECVKKLPIDAPQIKFLIAGNIPLPRIHHKIRQITGKIGPRSELEYAKYLAKKEGVYDDLIITGHRNDIYSIIDSMDVVVFPTRLDATGRPVFEGSYLGKPTIATVPNKRTRVLLDGETGFITPPEDPEALADAIIKLIVDPELRNKMGKNGHLHAKQLFDPKENIKLIHEIYERICQ